MRRSGRPIVILSASFYGYHGFTECGREFRLETPSGESITLDPEPVSSQLRAAITGIRSERVRTVTVSPEIAVRMFLEGILTAKHIARAEVTTAMIRIRRFPVPGSTDGTITFQINHQPCEITFRGDAGDRIFPGGTGPKQ